MRTCRRKCRVNELQLKIPAFLVIAAHILNKNCNVRGTCAELNNVDKARNGLLILTNKIYTI